MSVLEDRRRFIAADFQKDRFVATRFIGLNEEGERGEEETMKEGETTSAAKTLRSLRRCGEKRKKGEVNKSLCEFIARFLRLS